MIGQRGAERHGKKGGFTIVEMTLAMSFVAVLLIAITVLTINLSNIYNHGVTYKELTQSGSAISEDLRRTVGSANVTNIKYVNTSGTNGINRLCLGSYSYVWNELDDLGASATIDSARTKYGSAGTGAGLVKVVDPGEAYCTAPFPTSIPSGDANKAQELLSEDGNRDLAVYSMTVSPMGAADGNGIQGAASSQLSSGQGLYTIKLVLGTGDKTKVDASTTSCNPPSSGASADQDYCAINVFTTVVSVGNNVNRPTS